MIILKNQVNAIKHLNLYHWSHTFIRLALCGCRGVMHSYANIFELSQQSASFRLLCVSAHSLHPRIQLASVSLLTAELLEVIGNGRCFQVKEFTCIFGIKWCIQVLTPMIICSQNSLLDPIYQSKSWKIPIHWNLHS